MGIVMFEVPDKLSSFWGGGCRFRASFGFSFVLPRPSGVVLFSESPHKILSQTTIPNPKGNYIGGAR